jgi:hypothetical protein
MAELELFYLLDKQVKAIDLDSQEGTCKKLLGEAKTGAAKGRDALPDAQPLLDVLAKRPDLKGLPFRMGDECRTGADEAKVVQELSRGVRRLPSGRGRGGSYRDVFEQDMEFIASLKGVIKLRRGPDGKVVGEETVAATLAQMLQVENPPVRLHLVKTLAETKGGEASLALARRAVFDSSPEVREAAVKALQDRPRKEYRQLLLDGLRYPWAPAADHAAEALVALNDQESVFALADLLDEPDPSAPVQDKDKKWVVTEVVRVNHLHNCLLCHAPSFDRKEPIRGLIPERGKRLREVYYDSADGNFVRADVVYLRQDFSAMQPVPDADPWPTMQRFDYLTRKRELTKEEVKSLPPPKDEKAPPAYPQRLAVLWALRQLTGDDAGDRSEDWYRALAGWYYGIDL